MVVVELPIIKSVMLARVATRDEKKPLVLVLLVRTALVEKRFVVVAFVPLKFVVKKFVEVLFVIREDEANIF